MHCYLIDMLVCPACQGKLDWRISERRDDRIHTADARCATCGASYPIREGIGAFLILGTAPDDLWRDVDSQLTLHLIKHPDVERQLLRVPAHALNPADQFYRALALEERGDYAGARAADALAQAGLYTTEYRRCWESQCALVLERLSIGDGPVVDLASGRCYLVEKMAQRLPRTIVASDSSPRVLRRDRRWLEERGLYDRVSLVAFDARRTPFRTGAVQTLTTNLGLPNIREPDDLLAELGRIVAGTFLALSHFFSRGRHSQFPTDPPAGAGAVPLSPLRTGALSARRLARRGRECLQWPGAADSYGRRPAGSGD